MALTLRISGETAHAGGVQVYASVLGLEALDAILAKLEADAPRAVAAALYSEAQDILAASLIECPVDLGPLRASGHVELPVVTPTRVTVRLGYGGAATPYALRQHEELDFHHPTPGTKAKYLEDPVRRAERGFTRRLATRLHGRLAA